MAGPALFESHAKQTKWEWARSRRQRFSDPVKDIVPPVVVGLVTLGLTVAAGLSVGAATLVSITAGVVGRWLPGVFETIYWRWKYDATMLEESRLEVAALEARIADLEARLAAPSGGEDAALSAEQLRHHLGNLRLAYIQLEREFLAKNGAEELWRQQTRLHNTALEIIDHQLGRDYWAQFKDAKKEPLVVPKSFPREDHEALNLLFMIHGRSDWLSGTIDELRREPQRVKRVPPKAKEPKRLTDTRALIQEAAAYVEAMPKSLGDSRAAAEMSFMVWDTIPLLLDRAFLVSPSDNYKTFLKTEREKMGDSPDPRKASAAFLNRYAETITADNLDEGFLMPDSFEQFVEADGGNKWPANKR